MEGRIQGLVRHSWIAHTTEIAARRARIRIGECTSRKAATYDYIPVGVAERDAAEQAGRAGDAVRWVPYETKFRHCEIADSPELRFSRGSIDQIREDLALITEFGPDHVFFDLSFDRDDVVNSAGDAVAVMGRVRDLLDNCARPSRRM
jgi:hypothetical protein